MYLLNLLIHLHNLFYSPQSIVIKHQIFIQNTLMIIINVYPNIIYRMKLPNNKQLNMIYNIKESTIDQENSLEQDPNFWWDQSAMINNSQNHPENFGEISGQNSVIDNHQNGYSAQNSSLIIQNSIQTRDQIKSHKPLFEISTRQCLEIQMGTQTQEKKKKASNEQLNKDILKYIYKSTVSGIKEQFTISGLRLTGAEAYLLNKVEKSFKAKRNISIVQFQNLMGYTLRYEQWEQNEKISNIREFARQYFSHQTKMKCQDQNESNHNFLKNSINGNMDFKRKLNLIKKLRILEKFPLYAYKVTSYDQDST